MDFYLVPCDDVGEGAGLVAALSRQLASPRADLRDVGPIEVGIRTVGARAEVYVSAGALESIERAFARPPIVTKVDTLPVDVVWILHDGDKKFLGRSDVLSSTSRSGDQP
ncbi:MAG: hypothetical protein ACJ796_05275 [Gemmatimonadaceae bacterium]